MAKRQVKVMIQREFQLEVWTLMIQKSMVIPPSPMVLFFCGHLYFRLSLLVPVKKLFAGRQCTYTGVNWLSDVFAPTLIIVVLSSVAREITLSGGVWSSRSSSCSVNHILTQDPLTAMESCNGPISSNLSNSVTIINMSTTQKVNKGFLKLFVKGDFFWCSRPIDLGQSLAFQ